MQCISSHVYSVVVLIWLLSVILTYLRLFVSCGESVLLHNLQFLQEVTDCELHRDKTDDRRLCASQAWDIFNKYISSDASCNIGKSRIVHISTTLVYLQY